jgi:Protein of unknown function (DUF4239)
MMLWFSLLPSWAAFVILFVIANTAAVLGMLAGRRWLHAMGLNAGPPVINAWATIVGALCALLFAFTIVTLWNRTNFSYSNTDDEAAAIRSVARDLSPSQLPLLRAYINQTVDEWPHLCGGTQDSRVDASLLALQRVALPRKSNYTNDLYHQLSAIEDFRNRRWQVSSYSVPTELWVALIILSCAVLFVLSVALPERRELHVVLMVVVATTLCTLIWVLTVLEYPFCGHTGITPSEIAGILRTHLF